jgi:hypothetical protein
MERSMLLGRFLESTKMLLKNVAQILLEILLEIERRKTSQDVRFFAKLYSILCSVPPFHIVVEMNADEWN